MTCSTCIPSRSTPHSSSSSSTSSSSSPSSSSSSSTSSSSSSESMATVTQSCPPSTFTCDNLTTFVTQKHLNVVIFILRNEILLHKLSTNEYCLPSILRCRSAFPNDPSRCPEIFLLGRDHLHTNHLHLLTTSGLNKGLDYASIVELGREEDLPHVMSVVEQNPTLSFVDVRHLSSLRLLGRKDPASIRHILHTLLSQLPETSPLPIRIPPWFHPRFTQHLRRWVVSKLQHVIPEPDTSLSLVRSWQISSVFAVTDLRDPSRQQRWFVKASTQRKISNDFPSTPYDEKLKWNGMFGIEGSMFKYVANRWPSVVSGYVADCEERGYTLMKQVGRRFRRKEVSEGELNTFLNNYAAMQREAAASWSELLSSGFGDRRLCRLVENLRHALNTTSIENLPAFPEEYFEEVATQCEKIEAMSDISDTIVHTDLNSGNLSWDGSNIRVLDWAEACVSHPLVEASGMSGWMRKKYLRVMGMEDIWKKGELVMCLTALVVRLYLHELGPDLGEDIGDESVQLMRHCVRLLRRTCSRRGRLIGRSCCSASKKC